MEQDLSYIEKFNSEKFAKWLRIGFEDLLKGKRSAFAPLDYYILSWEHEDITWALKSVYDLLSGTSKSNFREGMKIAILNLPPEEHYGQILKELLFLAGKVYAYESIDAIVKQVALGFFGKGKIGESLFPTALNIIAGMSPSHKVPDAIKNFISSPNFKYEYAPISFLALCRAEPEKFPEHLELLRWHFHELHKNKEHLNQSYITAIRFVKYVGLYTIAEHLTKLYIVADPGKDYLDTDNWLIEALFLGKKAPLILDYSNKDGMFVIGEKNQKGNTLQLRLPEDEDRCYECISFLENILKINSQNLLKEISTPSGNEKYKETTQILAQNISLIMPERIDDERNSIQ